MEHVQYLAVLLTRGAKHKLQALLAFNPIFRIPEGWTRYMHHMTVRFKQKNEILPLADIPPLGTVVYMDVFSCYKDDKGMCVRVLPDPDPSALKMPEEQIPHITVATAPGIKPVYSNQLLREQQLGWNIEPQNGLERLMGHLCAVH